MNVTRTWLAVTALGALLPVQASVAADLPVKAKPIVAATFDWSGVYIGAHAGYGGGMNDWAPDGLVRQADFIASGALAGGQIGINKQLGSFVLGMELAGSWADISGKSRYAFGGPLIGVTATYDHGAQIDGLATIAGRAGLAADRWFVFAKAGLSVVHEEHSGSLTAVPGGALAVSGNEIRYAPMLGFGSEYALTGNWSLFGEYNFHYLGERTVAMRGTVNPAGVVGGPVAFDQRIDQSIHVIKAGVNYRWGGVAIDPSYTAVAAAPGNNWTGSYIGVQGGYAWGNMKWPDGDPNDPASDFRTDGWLAGGTIGANAQAGSFVLGVEGEILGTGIRGTSSVSVLDPSGVITTSALDSKIDWLALATGRAGFVVGSNLMLYGKGGVAIAQETHTQSLSAPPVAAASFTAKAIHTGVVAGAGAEYAIAPNWSVKAEYDYIRMFQQAVNLTGSAVGGPYGPGLALALPQNKVQQDLHLVKFGVNYHFNPLPVVVAKY